MLTREKLDSWYTPITRIKWHSHDVFTIKFQGTGFDFKQFINNLVVDFNEPKFGYGGELFDEN